MSNNRKKYTPNEELMLHSEVEGVCPLCSKVLLYEKQNLSLFKQFEIAHIYPLNPTPAEIALLANEERLSQDPNDLDNVICLCLGCHGKYDKPRTLEEYRHLLQIKKSILKKNKEKTLWETSDLEKEIMQLIDHLANVDDEEIEEDILEYQPKKIDAKINKTIGNIVKRKIHNNVEQYYHVVKNKFIELDKIQPLTTETISTQIKVYYLKLQRETTNQKEIFDGMSKWISRKANNTSIDACDIITSYFIQNCEIFK